jgi:hypothetical protein
MVSFLEMRGMSLGILLGGSDLLLRLIDRSG